LEVFKSFANPTQGTQLVVKVYNLCRVSKTDISAVLTVKSGYILT
jgi:hypothetical protein